MTGMSLTMIIVFVVILIMAFAVTGYTVALMWDDFLAAIRSRSASKPSSSSS